MTRHLCRGLLKLRWFHSKGAALVLVWTLLGTAGYRVSYELMASLTESKSLLIGAGVPIIVAAPFFGWLADAKLGNYKVVKISITLSFLSSVLFSLFCLINFNTSLSSEQNVTLRAVFTCIDQSFLLGRNILLLS